MATLAQKIAALDDLSSRALREEWCRVTGTPAPRISPAMTRLALASELQARVHGGLPRALRQMLAQVAAAKTPNQPRTRRDATGARRWFCL